MTNTRHQFGPASSFQDDYVVFAIRSRGNNDIGALPKLRQSLEMAIPFKPVNLGDARNGGCLRPVVRPQPAEPLAARHDAGSGNGRARAERAESGGGRVR